MPTTITISSRDNVTRVSLNRPDVRNAFNADMISELTEAFTQISADPAVRVVVLAGEGPTFCGGADVSWMRSALDLNYDQNVGEAEAMSDMFRAIDRCSKPVIGRIHGAALGGGAGLAAVCDIAFAGGQTIFGFTEVKLGIIPAIISPFVLEKIGISHARALFLTGERFSAHRAAQINLIHRVVDAEDLDGAIDLAIGELRTAGPHAIAAAKALIPKVVEAGYDRSREVTASAIAKQRISEEGQEGLRAFLERRKADFRQ